MKLSTCCIVALSASMLLATAGCKRESPTEDSVGSPRARSTEAPPTDRQEFEAPSVTKAALEASVKDRLAETRARLTRLEATVPPAQRAEFDAAQAELLERERTLQEQARAIADVSPADWTAFSKSLERSVAVLESDVARLDDDLGD